VLLASLTNAERLKNADRTIEQVILFVNLLKLLKCLSALVNDTGLQKTENVHGFYQRFSDCHHRKR